jgi:hypothetical protein
MTALMQKRRSALVVLLALCMVLVMPAAALAEGTTTTPKYTEESKQQFEQQLAKGEIKAAEFNGKLRSLHITTKNGTLYLYHYEKKGAPKLKQELAAKGIKYTVLTKSAASIEAKAHPKKAKHKIRYIVGAVVIVLIIVGLIIFFVRRRGMRD